MEYGASGNRTANPETDPMLSLKVAMVNDNLLMDVSAN
jgi:hypothetical protein